MNTRLVNCHLFKHPVPISAAITAIASQKKYDDHDYELIIRAAEYIKVLESLIDFFMDGGDEDGFFEEDEWLKKQDDYEIAKQALSIYDFL